jgi:uncharacterized membrane protein YeaQ/YmgE (transglycosylase-associated protein family)
MNVTHILLSLICGGVGGNLAGALLKQFSLGPIGNTILGLLGGGVGWKMLNVIVGGAGAGIGPDIIGSALGGGLLMTIVGLIKNAMAKTTP